MQITELLKRKHWIIKTQNGGDVSITQREDDFCIKHGDMIAQCPHEWFVVGGNIDSFNERSSKDNQSCISLGMGNPETGFSLMSIWLDISELADIESDDVLSKFLDIGQLDKEDCVF
jgi:hypothetical protein